MSRPKNQFRRLVRIIAYENKCGGPHTKDIRERYFIGTTPMATLFNMIDAQKQLGADEIQIELGDPEPRPQGK